MRVISDLSSGQTDGECLEQTATGLCGDVPAGAAGSSGTTQRKAHRSSRLIATSRRVGYAVSSVLAVAVFAGILLALGYLFFLWGLTVAISVFIVLCLAVALHSQFDRALMFIKKKFNVRERGYDQTIERLVRERITVNEPDRLRSYMVRSIARTMKSNAACLIVPASGDRFAARMLVGSAETEENVKLSALAAVGERRGDIIRRSELRNPGRQEKRLLNNVHGELIVPMGASGKLDGILVLGHKLDGRPYNEKDFDKLKVTAKQCAVVLESLRMQAEARKGLETARQLAESRADFLETVSHQLKTPITAIKASADMLSESTNARTAAVQSKLINSINRNVEALLKHVTELLDFARIEDGSLKLELEITSPNMLIDEVVTQITPLLNNKGQVLELNLPDSPPEVFVDRYRFEQVLLNLITNASKFTPEGGRITVSVTHDELNLFVAVADTGKGISEIEQQRIFEALPSANKPASGSGLGLPIARHLVELHGGKIWVKTKEREGSTFTFSIPLEATD